MSLRLHAPNIWQSERRNALRMLNMQRAKAAAEHRHTQADALLFASMDVEDTLRDRAAWLIEESTEMRWAHMQHPGSSQ